jgi:hypothetical protein
LVWEFNLSAKFPRLSALRLVANVARMPANFDDAFAQVKQLAADFKASENFYLSPQYQEAEVRKRFIDKFLHALGWDVNSDLQKNPFQQEVKIEPAVTVGISQRHADYAFYVAPNFRKHDVRFFVEAKKPAGELVTPDNCFQTIRYGANAGTPLAVLTNFRKLAILDSRYKLKIDTAAKKVIRHYDYTDYADAAKFREIFDLLSRDAVAASSLETFAAALTGKRGPAARRGLGEQPIGDAFLQELDTYRGILARAFKNRNPDLDGETLTEITQRTLDRLVFLRFLEDKGIETKESVARFAQSQSAWPDFVAASKRLNGIYNGIVFRHHDKFDGADFQVDDGIFKEVCQWLSDPQSFYLFDIIPIHTLGSIYERFLGKVIVTTDKRARVEEKPEVRKAGGVYYTPEYIVRYIVENTVGKLIEGKTPNQIAEMRFADIACGSGSFLLGVYDVLLDYHRKWFNANPDRAKKAGCVLRDGGAWHLSLQQRREILLHNLFGVDIDNQAVEVCQLSLYLKLLEDETTASAGAYQMEFHETLLPSLKDNIVCGNSVIGTDILRGELFEPVAERKLNPMDFEDRFAEIMKRGGFDAIVGNPPYVRPHNIDDETKKYFWQHYRTFTHKSDLYCCFMEKATRLLKNGGLFSYIVSHGWLRLNSFQELRRFILENYRIRQLVEFPYNVFAEAQVSTGIFVFEKSGAGQKSKLQIIRATPVSNNASFSAVREIPQTTFQRTFQNVFDTSISPETEAIKDKMRQGVLIGANFEICFGLKTGDDEKFLHETKGLHKEDKPLLRGDDVKRYETNYKGEFVWYVPQRMRAHRQTARPGEPRRFEQPKVLVKDTSSDFAGTYEPDGFYVKDVLIVIPKEGISPNYDLRFVAAVINSKALHFYYRTTFQTIHVQNEELASLPLPKIKFEDKTEIARHDKLVALVEQMLAAKQQLAAAQSDKEKDFYGNKCAGLDRQIDALVYELYGLTEDEITIVKGATA